ncbi:MAG: hypothetical protein QXH42_08665 [Thermoplasmata archaeon]
MQVMEMMNSWYVPPPPISRKQQMLGKLNRACGIAGIGLTVAMLVLGILLPPFLFVVLPCLIWSIVCLTNSARLRSVPLPGLSYDPKLYPKDIWKVWLEQSQRQQTPQQAWSPPPAQPTVQQAQYPTQCYYPYYYSQSTQSYPTSPSSCPAPQAPAPQYPPQLQNSPPSPSPPQSPAPTQPLFPSIPR